MTIQRARVIFASHMQQARRRQLTTYERDQLARARQTLRQHAKPSMNKRRHAKQNPGKPVLIYGKVQRIIAVKTQQHICDAECKAHGHRYYHDFKSNPKMYGLPDGSLLIK